MEKISLSFCHLIPFNLHHILSSYEGKNTDVYVKIFSNTFAELSVECMLLQLHLRRPFLKMYSMNLNKNSIIAGLPMRRL